MASDRSAAINMTAMAYTRSDNGGRRTMIDRRQFSYAAHIPERRTLADRRRQADRRTTYLSTQKQFASPSTNPEGVIIFPTSPANRRK